MKTFNTLFKSCMLLLLVILIFPTKSFSQTVSANPSSLAFGKHEINTETQLQTNILVTGLVTSLSSIQLELSGPNADQFEVPDPSLLGDLVELLEALLGGGIPVPVTYNPTTEGTHSANLEVTLQFILLIPYTETVIIPLTGEAILPLQVVSSYPSNNGTNILPATPIKIEFNKPVTVTNINEITINGQPVDPSWVEVTGNTITITPVNLTSEADISVVIPASAVKGTNDEVLGSNYSISYSTTPELVIPGSDPFEIESLLNTTTSAELVLTTHPILQNDINISNVIVEISGDDAQLFGYTIDNVQDFINQLKSGSASLDISYTPTSEGDHQANLTITLITDDNIPITTTIGLAGSVQNPTSIESNIPNNKVILKEEVYNLLGIKVSDTNARGTFIKKIIYTDGTTKAKKVIIRK